jgi:tetratricopeptide (TPR) repeat protein
MQNACAAVPSIALRLAGTRSNRDAIGARVEVKGHVQYVNAGSGFLSQHSKRLHFGLKGETTADVSIVWPSGLTQSVEALQPGFTYTIVEDSAAPKAQPFRPRRDFSGPAPTGNNPPAFSDTWLLQPVPTPESHQGPCFIVLHDGKLPKLAGLPSEAINLATQSPEVAAAWSLFHRYLFEYRSELSLPLLVLIDDQSRARKVYTEIPGETALRSDLAKIAESGRLSLPFPGRYCIPPRRNYFKLGVAFYWAGYPERALPYLEEELRARPDNWSVLLALGRIHQEIGNLDQALSAFRRVHTIRPGYAPAIVSAGLVLLRKNDPSVAREMFLKAWDTDPKCAEAANELGLMAAQANQLDDARNWFHRALEAVPGHAEAVNNLGVFYAQIHQYPDAIAALRYGIQYNPANEPLHLNLARILMIMGQRDEARAVLDKLLERHPESTLGRRLLIELEAR